VFHFLLTCFILIPPPLSPPPFLYFFFFLSLFILIFAPAADLSSLTIPFEEEEEEEEEEEKEEEEMYNDVDGFDSPRSGSQCRAMALPEPTEKEEDIYEVLPGKIHHRLTTHLLLLRKTTTKTKNS
jgi:hypothetical protein